MQFAAYSFSKMVKGTTGNTPHSRRETQVSFTKRFNCDGQLLFEIISNWHRCIWAEKNRAFISVNPLPRKISINLQNLIESLRTLHLCFHKDQTIIRKKQVVDPG
jgi:hypothetical protein